MEMLKVYFCVIVYIASAHVSARPLNNEDILESTCWRLRGTGLKLCLEEDEDDVVIEKQTPLAVLQQLLSFPLSNGNDLDKYNQDFAFQRRNIKYPAKKGSSEEPLIHKRPFDSISYNTGLGGFK